MYDNRVYYSYVRIIKEEYKTRDTTTTKAKDSSNITEETIADICLILVTIATTIAAKHSK